ncbi:hypothetical protein NQ966_17730, partial [Acinetobacter baumannii]|nr:hypothetical protein [Acinetobacter baumannii]
AIPMKKPLALLWKKYEYKNIIVTKNDGNECLGLMVVIRTLVKQTQTQLIGTTKIDHLVVNNQKFSRSGSNSFRSDTGEEMTLTQFA